MKHILVIDDAGTMRLYYRTILESAGYAVEEAWNGIEALERTLVKAPHCFLVDVNMPGLDGFSFLREVRQQAMAQVPAIVISTERSDDGRTLAYRSGANAFLAKPAAPQQLLLYIRLMIGEAAA
jgi:two-component system chemotaxis response regulator CheY